MIHCFQEESQRKTRKKILDNLRSLVPQQECENLMGEGEESFSAVAFLASLVKICIK